MMPRFDAPNLHHSAVLFYQLTRPRGARHFVFAPGPILKPFQLTRPRGARRRARRSKPARSQVSTHAPAGGATWSRGMPFSPSKFQLTRPRGARPTRCCILPHGKSFNSRAREGRDFLVAWPHGPTRRFNSRAREGRDMATRATPPPTPWFQLTRPRGTRLPNKCHRECHRDVSTHAPARGATRAYRHRRSRQRVSTHAPARGATTPAYYAALYALVSTHAPARGATSPANFIHHTSPCFNSRAREGRDWGFCSRWRPGRSFNSRAREGRDSKPSSGPSGTKVSTHAPARGATFPEAGPFAVVLSFNSRAREGRDAIRP